MLQLLRVLSFLPLILMARIRGEERRLIDRLRGQGALDRANAVTIDKGRLAAHWARQRLLRAGAIGDAGDGRYYLSEADYTISLSRRRRRAVIVLVVVLVGLAIAFYSGVVSL
jgi:hypothetical protein